MGASSSVQIRGRDNVIEAYRANDIDVWSVWQGRQFLTKGSGEPELAAFLDLLLRSGSNAIYTIRVYEDLTDAKGVKSNTPDSGSINFRLVEIEPGAAMGGYGSPMQLQINSLNDKFDRLLDVMQKREEEEEAEYEEPEEITGVTGAVVGLLKDPEKLGKFIDIVRPIFAPGSMPAQVGNVNRLQAPGSASLSPSPESEENRMQRIYNAVEQLNAVDPQLPEHLEKLAKMASANPGNFKSLLGMLDIF